MQSPVQAEQQVSSDAVKNDRAGGDPYTVMLATKLVAEEQSDTATDTAVATWKKHNIGVVAGYDRLSMRGASRTRLLQAAAVVLRLICWSFPTRYEHSSAA